MAVLQRGSAIAAAGQHAVCRKVASLNSGKGFAAPRLTTGENQLDDY
jgi:hypothetical protein